MKKTIILVTLLALMGLSERATAQTVIDQGVTGSLTWVLTSDSVLTISGSGAMPDYDEFYPSPSSPWYFYRSSISTVIIGDSVTSIGNYAFLECNRLTSITIPNNVTNIGNGAFANCSGLTSITIPNNLTTIGDGAFTYCSGLTSITIPNSVTNIGDYMFYGCSGLTAITIPNNVTNIGYEAFLGCSELTTITIPNNITTIGHSAFENCSGLTTINFNADSCINISTSCWYGCTSLETVNIGNNVKIIPSGAFNCAELITINFNADSCISIGHNWWNNCISVNIGNNVKIIPNYAFSYCTRLASVTIGNNVTIIGDFAFNGDIELASITIPNSVTTIGDYAFMGCVKFTSITIPNSVTNIGNNAFQYCWGLTSITSHATIPPALGSNTFNNVPSDIPVYIPCISFDNYRTASEWNRFTNFVARQSDTTFYTAIKCYNVPYTDHHFTTPINHSGTYYTQFVGANCNSVICLTLTEHPEHPAPPIQELCMVSVDENDNNEIVWKQADAVVSYNIYRESTFGSYDLIANIDYESPNRWIDSAVNAKMRPYYYRIAGIDTCGNESELSASHRTMYFTISRGQNNSWLLLWTPYEGVSYSTYNIYRASHHAHSSMELISTLSKGNNTYTDFSAPEGYVYYMIEIVLDNPCVLTKSLSSIKSNIATNNPNIGIAEKQRPSSLQISPNPTTGELRVENGELKTETVEVFDITGRKQYAEIRESNGGVLLNISHLPSGMYLVKVGGSVGKVVKQ